MCFHATSASLDAGRYCSSLAVKWRKWRMSGPDDVYDVQQCSEEYDRSSPRPPALGKENCPTSEMNELYKCSVSRDCVYMCVHSKGRSEFACSAEEYKDAFEGVHDSSDQPTGTRCWSGTPSISAGEDGDRRLECEAQGSADGTPPFTENGTPPYLKWAQGLNYLFDDREGVELFSEYLEQENCDKLSLEFWLACEGLKNTENKDSIETMIKVIFRRYIKSHNLGISKETRWTITEAFNSQAELKQMLFDEAQQEIEEEIMRTTYPNFLKSDLYLHHIQQMQSNATCDSPKHADPLEGSSRCGTMLHRSVSRLSLDILPTLPEDRELSILAVKKEEWRPPTKFSETGTRWKPESQAGHYLTPSIAKVPNPYHVKYSSYLPTSAQDSELQSISSDARTDDTISLTDTSSVDYGPVFPTKSQLIKHHKFMKQNASQNKDPLNEFSVIPRTQRFQKEIISETNPDQFAEIVIQKLNIVKQEQERHEKLRESLRRIDVRLTNNDDQCEQSAHAPMDRFHSLPPQLLVATLKEKLSITDESNQSILDEHVSRVWKDSLNHTPERSPGWSSPPHKSRSPPGRGMYGPYASHCVPDQGMYPYASQNQCFSPNYSSRNFAHHGYTGKHRKERETYSSDSGTVHDIVPDDEVPYTSRHIHRHIHHHLPPPGLIPPIMKQSIPAEVFPSVQGLTEHQLRMSKDACRRSSSSSKKSSTTDCVSSGFGSGANIPSQERVYNWVLNSEKYATGSQGPDSEKDSTRHKRSGHLPLSGTPSIMGKTTKKTSGKRGNTSSSNNNPNGANNNSSNNNNSGGATGSSGHTPSVGTDECTVIGYRFSDEQVPYRTKLPGKDITLKQFKTLLRKKGNYRYFFKRASNEFGTGAVFESITDDNKVLPLWENKIFCIIEAADASGSGSH